MKRIGIHEIGKDIMKNKNNQKIQKKNLLTSDIRKFI